MTNHAEQIEKIMKRYHEPRGNRDEWGLVLSGGGTRGAYEVGAWRALREMGIPIKGITGTSIGAINAALFVQDDYQAVEDLYMSIEIGDVLPVPDSVDPNRDIFDRRNLMVILREYVQQKGLDNEPLRRSLQKYLDLDKIYASPKDMGIVSFDLRGLEPLALFKDEIPKEKFIDYLLASANFPIYKTKKMDGKRLVDGGFYDNQPFNLLIRRGYRDIILVDINGIGLTRTVHHSEDVRIKSIRCSEDLGGLFNFDKKRIRQNIELGYLDTMRAYRQLVGNEFFFYPRDFQSLMTRFDLTAIAGLETAARLYGLDRYRPYHADEFLRLLLEAHLSAESELNIRGAAAIPGRVELSQFMEEGLSICRLEKLILERPTTFEDIRPILKMFPEQVAAAKALIELRNAL